MTREEQVIKELNNLGKDYPCLFCGGVDLDYCGEDHHIAVYCRKCNECGPWTIDIMHARLAWRHHES